MGSISLETGQLVFVRDECEGWLPATVGATKGQGHDMSLELHHEDGTVEVSNFRSFVTGSRSSILLLQHHVYCTTRV